LNFGWVNPWRTRKREKGRLGAKASEEAAVGNNSEEGTDGKGEERKKYRNREDVCCKGPVLSCRAGSARIRTLLGGGDWHGGANGWWSGERSDDLEGDDLEGDDLEGDGSERA
jgi:hypothetical protein